MIENQIKQLMNRISFNYFLNQTELHQSNLTIQFYKNNSNRLINIVRVLFFYFFPLKNLVIIT